LVAGFTMVAIVAAVLIRFNHLIGPLLLAFVLSYLLHPLATRLSASAKLSWRASVNLIFFIFLLIIALVATLVGYGVLDQLGTLVNGAQNFLASLPEFASQLATQAIQFGPFRIDFSELERTLIQDFHLDFATIGQQLLASLQPALGRAGTLIGVLATSALSSIGWSLFVFIISYFLLLDTGGVPTFLQNIDLPGHSADLSRMGRELGRIWNAFLRGQLLVVTLIIISYFFLMEILGVHNALGLAFLTGLAKFVPYVGPLVAGATAALVAFFQGGNYLNIVPPLLYAGIVVVATLVLDQTFDNLVTPRIYGRVLGVHPAAVLVAALIAASLLGFVGLLLAAPVFASLQLFLTYAIRKMLDLDPWPMLETESVRVQMPLARPLQAIAKRLQVYAKQVRRRRK
jgi:predicted PurR-regulated permease PerM